VADWYPKKLSAGERLPYYAQHFNFVELNSSFYGIPARRQVERWCEQTPPNFVFDVKLHKCAVAPFGGAIQPAARSPRGRGIGGFEGSSDSVD
jgi:hypothetical protein